MILHHIPGSRSFRVLWLLEELGQEVELQSWSVTDRALRSPEFRALSPAGRIPALDIDGTAIFESGAIVQVLTERAGRLAPAPGTPERGAFLGWVSFAETQANILQNLNFHHIFLRPPEARSAVMTKLDTKRLEVTMRAMEVHLTGRDWLLDEFSAADCMFGFNIEAMFRFVRPEGFPALAAWVARAKARPAYRRALEKGGATTIYTQDFYELADG
ncbi:MAG: glutathione S-transferase family protein [Sphingomonadales bacterium]|nr:glutathione S-transferase family protein [Sphingomonadales bacterium]